MPRWQPILVAPDVPPRGRLARATGGIRSGEYRVARRARMLAGLDDFLGACRSGRERLSGRCFGGLTLTARVINALDRIFAVHHPVLSCLALELSIEHPAGEDGCRP